MPELDEYDSAIIEAAHCWWSVKRNGPGGNNFALMSPQLRDLAQAIEAKREAIMRAQEFGPTPAEEYPIDERVESLEMDRDYLQVQLRHVVSFLGPAFKQWEEKCRRT